MNITPEMRRHVPYEKQAVAETFIDSRGLPCIRVGHLSRENTVVNLQGYWADTGVDGVYKAVHQRSIVHITVVNRVLYHTHKGRWVDFDESSQCVFVVDEDCPLKGSFFYVVSSDAYTQSVKGPRELEAAENERLEYLLREEADRKAKVAESRQREKDRIANLRQKRAEKKALLLQGWADMINWKNLRIPGMTPEDAAFMKKMRTQPKRSPVWYHKVVPRLLSALEVSNSDESYYQIMDEMHRELLKHYPQTHR